MDPLELTVIEEEGKYHIPADSVNYDDRVKVLNHFDTFAVLDRWGDVQPHGKKVQGIYHQGMRFLSRLELRINHKKPLLLSSNIREDNDMLSVDLTNPDLDNNNILESTLHLSRSKFLRNGVYYEELCLVNYGSHTFTCAISIAFGADFKDIFEVRGINRTVQTSRPELSTSANTIAFTYHGLDGLKRRTEIVFSNVDEPDINNHIVTFHLTLVPHEDKKINYSVLFNTEEKFFATGQEVVMPDYSDAKNLRVEDIMRSRALFPEIVTSNEQFNQWICRSQADLLSLLTQTPFGKYPYAGVPWYNTAFGRDGIITAMQVLWIAPEIGRDVLRFLSKMQATEMIAAKDAEPGKILHETRTGEMANTNEIPFKEYYGTIDATPLYIMLAGMYYERTGNLDFIKTIWSNLKAALHWIDHYGDIDGDGFVEYKHKSENGLTNQGWKDSHDSISYADGKLCEPPIALCEVQGYVYAAKKHASNLAKALNEEVLSNDLLQQAEELKRKFNEAFWDSDLDCYVLALDGHKKPCRVVSSNAGHCLFTGIADEDKACSMAKVLVGEHMFSGWGIRTLSKDAVRYNPMSYHNGSIWPHDNSLTAFGFAKYGLQKETLKVLNALFDASLYIELQRLPELYCGFERRPNEGPTAYPVACSPQAWAVGAVFILLQACLHIEINALEKKIIFHKLDLPDFLEKITISNLRLNEGICQFELFRYKYDIGFHIIQKPEGWELIIKK
ncbi:amylo-alpha-1,6-glucosidase [Chitinophagaceae bacterium LB-8]|uniref:Amylo-alpha-1,6-glucosidase n=1 Tax=Paraflavisolibacter caeni TaxID=2982496 RepID=A0A9X2XPP7_9BACT|nr:amylo-alpha-1,6-glucosidase [Paraflavisolibacter caeni]MCU7551878.1 amylo-alpha-1,6-glucosidase [Paraflavisolibacter caeni]